jgi:hypothetical protein
MAVVYSASRISIGVTSAVLLGPHDHIRLSCDERAPLSDLSNPALDRERSLIFNRRRFRGFDQVLTQLVRCKAE